MAERTFARTSGVTRMPAIYDDEPSQQELDAIIAEQSQNLPPFWEKDARLLNREPPVTIRTVRLVRAAAVAWRNSRDPQGAIERREHGRFRIG